MLKTPLFRLLLGLLGCIAIIHIVSTVFYLYWSVERIHTVIHFLSGMLVALTALWYLYLSGYVHLHAPQWRNPLIVFLICLVASLFIGLVWEAFELHYGLTYLSDKYYFYDNGADIINDVAGGLVGYAYFIYKGYNVGHDGN